MHICRLTVARGDISAIHVDAIVNAANEQLRYGDGVCRSIFDAAGVHELTAECSLLQPCPTGGAVITSSFRIAQVKNIIHAVGPDLRNRQHQANRNQLLAACYQRSLDLMKDNRLRSIVPISIRILQT